MREFQALFVPEGEVSDITRESIEPAISSASPQEGGNEMKI